MPHAEPHWLTQTHKRRGSAPHVSPAFVFGLSANLAAGPLAGPGGGTVGVPAAPPLAEGRRAVVQIEAARLGCPVG
jgi:hypothetical protein